MKTPVIAAACLLVSASTVLAQNSASNKAFFASNQTGVVFTTVSGAESPVVTLMDLNDVIKTSNGGAISAILSMETLLSTYNSVTATNGNGKNSTSSRAMIVAWIEVDGVAMTPGQVVFDDRLQATGLTLDLTCLVEGTVCTVNGDLTLDLYQQTKSANSFVFFLGPLSPTLHDVKVKAKATIECHDNAGAVVACSSGTLAGYANASTQAGLGKATLLLEEQQNWGASN
jgi:hypothetical protein